MGLEKERCETCVFMDEEAFNSSIDPILRKKSNAFPPVKDRNPYDMNAHLQVDFEDVIAEPSSVHSVDSVWIGSHALFELIKFVFYRILTTLFAVPMAFVAGVAFGILSCVYIWLLVPFMKCCMVLLPSIQVVWTSLTEAFVIPLFSIIGRFLSAISVKYLQN